MQITRDTLLAALALPVLHVRSLVDARQAAPAAVAVPVRLAPEPTATLLLRASTLRDHAGEVGFPGGKRDPGDPDLRATALRELEEEVAIAAAEVEVLGELHPMPVITGRYVIHPFVVLLAGGRLPRAASPEIARLLDVPLLPWISGAIPIRGIAFDLGDERLITPHFELDGCVLYGASAYIFHELLLKLAGALGRELPAPILQDELPWGRRYDA